MNTLRTFPLLSFRSFSTSSLLHSMETSIRTNIEKELQPTYLKISNDSKAHAHHSAMRSSGGGNGETHFSVVVVSEKFGGVKAIGRHRLINAALKPEFDAGLHALAIKAMTPEEWELKGKK